MASLTPNFNLVKTDDGTEPWGADVRGNWDTIDANLARAITGSSTYATLPPNASARTGEIRRVTDEIRGLWIFTGVQWVQLGGESVNVKEFGAIGDGVEDDAPAIQAAFDAASAWASASGQRVTVIIPPGLYRCEDAIYPKNNTRIINCGEMKFFGGNAIGGFCIIRAQSNIEITGGVWNSNNQQNDNTIAAGFEEADGVTLAGPPCENLWVHDLIVKNSKHGGSHIADITAPGDIGRGGGKGITFQHGVKKAFVSNVLIDTCELGFSVEGKETNSGYVQDVVFANVVVKNARYMGCLLWGVHNTASLIGQVQNLLLTNVSFFDCASGTLSDGSGDNIAEHFGVIVTQAMTAVRASNVQIKNSSGVTTVLRGAHRHCDWDLHVFCDDLADVVNSAPYSGYNPQNAVSRYNRFRCDLSIIGNSFTGYLVNSDATYDAGYGSYEFEGINFNAGTPASIATARYSQNFPSTSVFIFRDRFTGRFVFANDGAAQDGTVSGIQTFFNGLGIEDDSGNALVKIASTRTNLALAGPSGGSQALVSDSGFIINGKLTFAQSDLTIAAGVVTVTRSRHRIDTEGGGAADDLDTINGGENGQLLLLSSVSAARVVTVTDNVGNIQLSGSSMVLDNPVDTLLLEFNTTANKWLEVARSNNA